MADSPPSTVVVPNGSSSIIASGERLTRDIVGGFTNAPVLMLILLLNVAMIAAAAWFLLAQEGYRHDERIALGELLKACFDRNAR